MAEASPPLTLQQRIAALNAAHIGRMPGELPPPVPRQKPEIQIQQPQRPGIVRQSSVNLPPEQVNGTVAHTKVGNQPHGPPPLPDRRPPPPLPQRKASEESGRQSSTTSVNSISTNASSTSRAVSLGTKTQDASSRVKAPVWGEGGLPTLPQMRPTPGVRTSPPERPTYTSRASQQSITSQRSTGSPSVVERQTLPPPLPTRTASTSNSSSGTGAAVRKVAPLPTTASIEKARRSAFTSKSPDTESAVIPFQVPVSIPVPVSVPTPVPIPVPVFQPDSLPGRPARPTVPKHALTQPPPVPHASRPDLAAIQATKPRPATTQSVNAYLQQPNVQAGECMICRDFSAPDQHASTFPRQQVSSLQTLALQLTSPFSSATDKARVIFTWLHHNISYDVDRFFAGNLQPSTPQSTLQSGLAVCEGYAALFANLATYAGLEAMVVSGHGKGYGHQDLAPGEPIPPFDSNHAWNVVKIDHGEWKLIDPCWGAGHVQGAGMPYVQMFHPNHFTMTNEEFGIKHFPTNKDQFFLPGGRRMTWEEYIPINPDSWPDNHVPPTLYSNGYEDYGIGKKTLCPPDRQISVRQPGVLRFQFGLPCPHWTLEKHTKKGPPPLFCLAVHGVDGRNSDHVPFEYIRGTNPGGGGDVWYVDVPARELGAPGQTLTLFAVTTFGSRPNARGLTVQEFRQGRGRIMVSFVGVASWDLV